MKFLVIGNGAREDAICTTLIRTHKVAAAPGNPGMKKRGVECYPDIKADNITGLFALAIELGVDVTVVGPEAPLSLGIADRFREKGLRIVGPSQTAAMLENSKIYAKQFMTAYEIPTATYVICESYEEAVAAIRERDGDCVLKADGLAGGKGVTVCDNFEQALRMADEMMNHDKFGDAGRRILVEERLHGRECSAIFLCDGVNAMALKKAQDYKRRFDGDLGPNTGGMGARCPVFEDPVLDLQIMNTAGRPTLIGMAEMGTPFMGFLYVGIMLTTEGPKVIEFNVRLGDPEASAILPLLITDLGEVLFKSTALGGLSGVQLQWQSGFTTTVVLASDGYPESYLIGRPITGITIAENNEHCEVFHAGTRRNAKGRLVTAGGRVLNVVGFGATEQESANRAYRGVNRIKFKGKAFRRDIGRNL